MITLLGLVLLSQAQSSWTFAIDITNRTPISPYIYGVNHPDWAKFGPGITLARQGGNRMTAYNWETNASNAGNDWQHQNDSYIGGDHNEPGWAVKEFLDGAQSHGAAAIVTVPTAGYVAADKNGDGDVNKTPDYLNKRFHKSLAKSPKPTFPPDTTDKFVYQDEFVAWLEKVKSPKTPLWFSLDNEPDLWQSTHARIVPKNLSYAQIIANNTEFASAIKDAAPKSLVFGPANYGWQGFRRFQDAPDATNRDFLDVYLAAMNDAEKKAGKRLLDVLDIHWYPEAQGGGVRIAFGDGKGEKPETQAARIQAPRSLWDPTYVETSWIADSIGKKPIALLPGVLGQIKKNYPGTKLAITEYNYGGPNHISGAIAQADVLGVFGRQGLFAACNWGLNPNSKAELAGFQAFRDFDRKGSVFGDTGLAVSGEYPSMNSVYASVDSQDPRRLTIVAINKSPARATMSFRVPGFNAKSAAAYTIEAESVDKPKVGKPQVRGNGLTMTVPGESIVTIELRG